MPMPSLPHVEVIPLTTRRDERGWLTEIYREMAGRHSTVPMKRNRFRRQRAARRPRALQTHGLPGVVARPLVYRALRCAAEPSRHYRQSAVGRRGVKAVDRQAGAES